MYKMDKMDKKAYAHLKRAQELLNKQETLGFGNELTHLLHLHYIDDEGKRIDIKGPTLVLLLPEKHIRDDHRRGKIDDPLGAWNTANIGIYVESAANIDRMESKPDLQYQAFRLRERLQEKRPKLNLLNGLWKLTIDKQVYLCSSDKTLTQIYDYEDHKRDLPRQQPSNDGPQRQPSNDGPHQQPLNYLPPQQPSNDGTHGQPSNDGPQQQPLNDQQPSNALPPHQSPVSRRDLPPKKRIKY